MCNVGSRVGSSESHVAAPAAAASLSTAWMASAMVAPLSVWDTAFAFASYLYTFLRKVSSERSPPLTRPSRSSSAMTPGSISRSRATLVKGARILGGAWRPLPSAMMP